MSPPTDILALERRALRAWPAIETREVAGWVQRLSGGYTKRANSINALNPETDFTLGLKDQLEAAYRDCGLPPICRLTPLAPAATDSLLAQAGYRRIDESLVQRASLDSRFTPDDQIEIAAAPSTEWLAGFAALSAVAPQHRETMARMLRSIAPPVGFARVEDK